MKIRIYSNKSDKKLRQVMSWCSLYGLEYEVMNINRRDFTYDEYKNILSLTDEGTYDLIAKRSKVYADMKDTVEFEDMSMREYYEFLLDNPEVVNQPIVVGDRKLAIGFKPEDISVFLPKEHRGIRSLIERGLMDEIIEE